MSDHKASLSSTLNRAVSAFKSGQLVEAERLCQLIVTVQPYFFDARHLLALVQSLLGKKEMALASYDRALQIRPNYAEAHSNRGGTLHELGRFDEALESFDRALKARPDYAEALHNRGLVLHALKRFDEALACFDRALKVRPDYAEALLSRGLALHELKRLQDALASYERALKVRPNYAEALFNGGNILHELKRFDEALARFDRALKVRPGYAEALCNRGLALHELELFEEAVASFDRALKVRPNYAEAHCNPGGTLHELQRFDEALASFDGALKVRPDFAEALSNRGSALHELKRFDEALTCFDHAVKVRPDYAEALLNRGSTLHHLKRFDEALAIYGDALRVRPDFAEAHCSRALCRMLIGDFDDGWEENEWRWNTERQKRQYRDFVQPLWLGSEEIAGKTILLHGEQGFGDVIQFCRYVPLVAERPGRIILEVLEPLRELMGTLSGAAQVIAKGDPLPNFDLHCPMLSLPLAFGTGIETIPCDVPYLHAAPTAVLRWNERLGPRHRPRVGLVWSGSPRHKNDRNRSLKLRALLPLVNLDALFVSLQREVRTDDAAVLKDRANIIHFGEELRNFADTAALISNLDLVISVDTSVAHLAGALSKPVWVLLPFIPDWRWLLDRDDSPWYPSARLFRQDESRAWEGVVARVHRALREFIQIQQQ
jgi:tetratricopeptide (TPR) repeat protein